MRTHRPLRAAGVEAQLEVYEGQSHAQYLFDDRLSETAVAFGEIVEFFDKHLGKLRQGRHLLGGDPSPLERRIQSSFLAIESRRKGLR